MTKREDESGAEQPSPSEWQLIRRMIRHGVSRGWLYGLASADEIEALTAKANDAIAKEQSDGQ